MKDEAEIQDKILILEALLEVWGDGDIINLKDALNEFVGRLAFDTEDQALYAVMGILNTLKWVLKSK